MGAGPWGDLPDSVPAGSCSLSFQEPALRGYCPGWRPDGLKRAVRPRLCGARSRSRRHHVPPPESRVVSLSAAFRPCPRVRSARPSGPPGWEPCRPQSHVLSCSSSCFRFRVPCAFHFPFFTGPPILSPLFNSASGQRALLGSQLPPARLCLSVPDFDLCVYTLTLKFPCCSNCL